MTIFLWRTRTTKGRRQSDQHCNCFRGHSGQTSERRDGASMAIPKRVDNFVPRENSGNSDAGCHLHLIFRTVSNFSIMKTLTLLVHAGLFWCFHNPPNSNLDYRIFNVRHSGTLLLLLLLLLYSVRLQHHENSDTFSGRWVILVFP